MAPEFVKKLLSMREDSMLGEGGRKRGGGRQARSCMLVGLMQAVALALVRPASAHECDRARSRVARKILDVELYNKVRTAQGRKTPRVPRPVPNSVPGPRMQWRCVCR